MWVWVCVGGWVDRKYHSRNPLMWEIPLCCGKELAHFKFLTAVDFRLAGFGLAGFSD